jgi:hypothetical protein
LARAVDAPSNHFTCALHHRPRHLSHIPLFSCLDPDFISRINSSLRFLEKSIVAPDGPQSLSLSRILCRPCFLIFSLTLCSTGSSVIRDYVDASASSSSSSAAIDSLQPLFTLKPHHSTSQPASYSSSQTNCHVSALHWSPLFHELLVVAYAPLHSESTGSISSIVIWYIYSNHFPKAVVIRDVRCTAIPDAPEFVLTCPFIVTAVALSQFHKVNQHAQFSSTVTASSSSSISIFCYSPILSHLYSASRHSRQFSRPVSL